MVLVASRKKCPWSRWINAKCKIKCKTCAIHQKNNFLNKRSDNNIWQRCQEVWHRFDCQLRSVMTTMKTLFLCRMRTLLPFCLGPHNERKVVPWAKGGGRQPSAMYIYMYIYACMYDSNSIDKRYTKWLLKNLCLPQIRNPNPSNNDRGMDLKMPSKKTP